MRQVLILTVIAAATFGGCSAWPEISAKRAGDVARYATSLSHNVSSDRNLIDRALSECPDGTQKSETICVQAALSKANISSEALVSMIPNCKIGLKCTYEHTTRRKIGLVEATATLITKRWQIEFDFRKPRKDVSQVPLTVVDQDNFSAEEDYQPFETPKRICQPRSKGPFACH